MRNPKTPATKKYLNAPVVEEPKKVVEPSVMGEDIYRAKNEYDAAVRANELWEELQGLTEFLTHTQYPSNRKVTSSKLLEALAEGKLGERISEELATAEKNSGVRFTDMALKNLTK